MNGEQTRIANVPNGIFYEKGAPVTKPRPWSPEDEKILLEMRAAGVNWRKMADTLDRTVAACEGRLAKLKKEGRDTEK